MRSPIFTLLFCFFSSLSFAQVELESERDEDGNVIFYATNAASIPYSVLFNFSSLNNLATPGGSTPLVVANPGRTPVLRLRPSREG
ncbi:hypothetical protein, partial [uncultured Algoriphagus sp.]|uniref:hypothetical protein n=1 Tax=uncultured Algoriphagus sp. TaxID=417365 RepID=UPI0025929616